MQDVKCNVSKHTCMCLLEPMAVHLFEEAGLRARTAGEGLKAHKDDLVRVYEGNTAIMRMFGGLELTALLSMVGQRPGGLYSKDEVRKALLFGRDLRASHLGMRLGTFAMWLRSNKEQSLIAKPSRLLLLLARGRSGNLVSHLPREILLLIFERGVASTQDITRLEQARKELQFGSERKKLHDKLESQVLSFSVDPAMLYRFLLLLDESPTKAEV